MSSDLDKMYWQGYDKGVDTTLQQLADVYEDIKETDVWREFYAEAEQTER